MRKRRSAKKQRNFCWWRGLEAAGSGQKLARQCQNDNSRLEEWGFGETKLGLFFLSDPRQRPLIFLYFKKVVIVFWLFCPSVAFYRVGLEWVPRKCPLWVDLTFLRYF
jgi:hypothetical protein